MNDFLDDLHFFCTERLTPPQVPSYQAAIKTVCGLEDEIEQTLGKDFYSRLDQAYHEIYRWEMLQSFQAGLRFGADFTHTVWGQSSQTSEP